MQTLHSLMGGVHTVNHYTSEKPETQLDKEAHDVKVGHGGRSIILSITAPMHQSEVCQRRKGSVYMGNSLSWWEEPWQSIITPVRSLRPRPQDRDKTCNSFSWWEEPRLSIITPVRSQDHKKTKVKHVIACHGGRSLGCQSLHQ